MTEAPLYINSSSTAVVNEKLLLIQPPFPAASTAFNWQNTGCYYKVATGNAMCLSPNSLPTTTKYAPTKKHMVIYIRG